MLHHIEFCLDEIDCEIDSHLGSTISEAEAATLKSKLAEVRAIIASWPLIVMADDAAGYDSSSVELIAEATEVPATAEIEETTDAPAEIVELIAEATGVPATAEIAETTDAPAEIVELIAEATELPATAEIEETTDAPAEIVELIAEATELPATAEIEETTDAPAEIVELIAEAAELPATAEIEETTDAPAEIVELIAEATEVPATAEIEETTDAPAEIVELIAEAAELPATAEIEETTDAPAEIVELIAEAPAIAADNLLLIRGMDDETATLLNGKGMTFAAMTGWRAADIAELALDARRVASEGWIEQAAVLAAGRLTHFAARVERGELACVVAKMDEIALPALASMSVTTTETEAMAAEEAITEETTAPTLIVSSSYLPPVFDGMPPAKTEVTEAASKVESEVEAETAKDETTAPKAEAKIEIEAKTNVIELAPRTSDRKWLRRASLAASLLLLMSVGVIGMQHKLPSMSMIQQIVSVD